SPPEKPKENLNYEYEWEHEIDFSKLSGDIERDIGILKYSDDGTKLLWATYLGGSHNEDPHSMVVNSNQELIVFGNTGSDDFPTTISAYDTSFNGRYDIFIAHLSKNGANMLNCTYLGGSSKDGLNGQQGIFSGKYSNSSELGWNYGDLYRGEVIVDEKDNIYISTVTQSDDFPIKTKSHQKTRNGKHDAIVIKMKPDLSDLLASTYLGGLQNDAAYGIALDRDHNVFICGGTQSAGFPFLKNAVIDTFVGGIADGFVAKFNNNLDSLLAGTYFGTPKYDQAYLLQVSDQNEVYITGQTRSDSFPILNTKFNQAEGKQFIAKMDNNLDTLYFSSVFGSGRNNPDLSPSAFLVDQCERIYFTGWGGGANFSFKGRTTDLVVTNDALKKVSDSSDFYLAVFSANMDTIIYGSYFGGSKSDEHVDGGTSRYDRSGVVYQSVCAGCGAGASDFPVTKGAYSEVNAATTGNLCNNAIFKLNFDAPVLYADFDVGSICIGETINPKDYSINAIDYYWDFGDGTTTNSISPTHKFADTGTFTIKLIVGNVLSCPGKDTLEKTIKVYNDPKIAINYLPDDCGWSYDFKNESQFGNTFKWKFGDGNQSNLENASHKYADTGQYNVMFIVDEGTACADSVTTYLKIDDSGADFKYLVDSCEPYVNFFDNSDNAVSWLWEFEPGKFGSDNAPGHYFSDTGAFDVKLIINPDKPCVDSVYKTIKVENVNRKARFTLNIDSCNFNLMAKNESNYYSGFKWVYSDTLKTELLNWNVEKAGTYELKLIADPFSACPDTSIRFITLNDLPKADFELLTDSCLSKVSLINNSTFTNTFKWTTNNQKSTAQNPEFVYADTGTYFINLIANPFSACADTVTDTAIIDLIKYAEFTAKVVPCSSMVVLTNSSKSANTIKWNYGAPLNDYELINDSTVKYTGAGAFTITLIIDENDANCADTFSRTLNISPAANASFKVENEYCQSYFNFKANASSGTFNWFIDNALKGTNQTIGYKFNDTLNHKILLVITDTNGCIDSVFSSVNAQIVQNASFTSLLDSCSGNAEFYSTSTDASSHNWYINNNNLSTEATVTTSLPEPDKRFEIKLITNANTPCADTAIDYASYNIQKLEELLIPSIFTPNGDEKNDEFRIDSLDLNCDEFAFYIYDRWGILVLKLENEPIIWKGLNRRLKAVNSGTYFYLFEKNDETRTGSITLVR
ncbi:MAG: PKD domain-containing protein, partial [Bacteroidia bacterium]